ncbi:MAG TPA: sodium:proton antiporter [Candidatus Alistipes faecavium]|nr:sodium:proton antiporter [Candidatus Alistipes faecavium]
MRKVLSFSLFLMLGLVASQLLPGWLGEAHAAFKAATDTLLYVCLGFIMINVGREFEIDKSRWRSYTADYFIAMATAALPWLLIVLYYIFVLLPPSLWGSAEAWKENLLLSRFAAPTSAGILFTMLAALHLKSSWIYRKIQVLAIFDDLDTILLMIPLQILMIGLKWQMFAIVGVVAVLLAVGWRWQATWDVKQDWRRILGLSVAVCAVTQGLYLAASHWFGHDNSIHIEVLLPAFVVGMLMKHRHIDTAAERRVATGISFFFMLLVGLSMPLVTGAGTSGGAEAAASVTASQPMMPWGVLALHVVAVSALSNLGKLVPLFFYRDRSLRERLALSVGMFTRGEVGAGVIFIALGYNLGGPALIVSVLTIVLNLILTGGFVVWVKHLALRSATPDDDEAGTAAC